VAIAGLVIGLRFRVPALLTAAALLTCGTIAVAIHFEWSFLHTATVVIVLLVVHQAAYLVGLFASSRR
jgi:hypothetical protein